MITVTRMCPMCGLIKEKDLEVTPKQLLDYKYGRGFIQDIFPNLSSNEREFIKTGYCFDCQEMLFGSME